MSRALLLDAGNTRLKWALADHGATLDSGALDYADLSGLPLANAVNRVMACNVAGEAVAQQLAAQLAGHSIEWLQSVATRAGVHNGYSQPAQLGSDRFAAMIGARGRVSDQPCVVVMAGTAMTVDALAEDGHFIGGLIVPGLRLMRAALQQGTANLGLPAGQAVDFPCSTGEAIHSGAHAALVGAVRMMVERLHRHSGMPPVLLVSGGDAASIAPLLEDAPLAALHQVDNLVLDGLARLWREAL